MNNQRKKSNKRPDEKTKNGLNKTLFLVICSGVVLLVLSISANWSQGIFNPLYESWEEFVKTLESNSGSLLNSLSAFLIALAYLIYSSLETIVRIAWEIPYLDIWALWTVGGLVEVYYTSRPTVFSNVITLVLFYKHIEIEFHWIEILTFCYIGFGILFAIVCLVHYSEKNVSGKKYNRIAYIFYGSLTCGAVMLLVYFHHTLFFIFSSLLSP